MILMEIAAGSRLHFGLLHVPVREASNGREGTTSLRAFGGAGLMIEEPALRLEARKADRWSAEGPLAAEIMAYAEVCRRALGEGACSPLTIQCHSAPPRHAGFGSGTQLGLGVARLVNEMSGRPDVPIDELARMTGRGKRSAIGANGFLQGGFLVEAGKLDGASLPLPIFRAAFPAGWPVVVVLRQVETAIFGSQESKIFNDLQPDASALKATESLCRILIMGILPALLEQDYGTFGESLFEFNRKAGERFAAVQGGPFAAGGVAAVIESIRQEGCRAVGQSSWGPAVFAICSDEKHAARVEARARQLFQSAHVFTTHARNQGANLIRQ
jgi:beta-RFAP synthase